MQSFIITSQNKRTRETYIKEHAQKYTIHQFDITLTEKDTAKKTVQSIGIEEIKKIQEKIFLKPLRSTIKLIVLEDAHLLTPEAQNALLKVLEEPPANTHIILSTETKEALLPTIISRCQIIELETPKQALSATTREEVQAFIAALPELSLAERLKLAEKLAKEKEKALIWIENLILVLREKLLETYALEIVVLLKQLQALHTLLQTTNVNPRFAIEHTLCNL